MAEQQRITIQKANSQGEKAGNKQPNVINDGNSPLAQLMSWHQTAGNQAVQRMLAAGAIQGQTRGAVAEEQVQGAAEEEVQKEEEEELQGKAAEEEQVVQGAAEEEVQKAEEEELQGKAAEEEQVVQGAAEEEVQKAGAFQFAGAARSDPYAAPQVMNAVRAQRGQGEILPLGLRGRMERSLGADFGAVRVHRDPTAAQLNGMLAARAFTNRNDIYFNQGQYNPDTQQGQHLVAHELAHVVQQRNISDLQFQLNSPSQRSRYEREADTAADQTMAGLKASVQPVNAKAKGNAGNSVQLAAEPVQCGFFSGGIDWVLGKLNPLIRKIPGYDLLTYVIGKDPLTGDAVKRDGANLIRAVVGLIPGGSALFDNLSKSGVIPRAVSWFGEEFAKLNLSFEMIKKLFSTAVNSLSAGDLLDPGGAFERIKTIFLAPIQRIGNFVKTAGPKLMEFVFEGALALVGAPVQSIMGILNKGKDVLKQIISNPIGFLGNLLKAVTGGFNKFLGNIVKHLQQGLMGWLFGAIEGAGLVLPKELDLAGIFSIITQILGVTWQAIRAKIVKALGPAGEKIMAGVEKSLSFVVALVTKGPLALLEQAKEFLGELQSMFFDTLIGWLRNTIIGKAITKLVSMFNPVGAIIQAVMTIYSTIKFLIERAKQIAALGSAIFDSIAEIAGGNVAKAVGAVENALVKALPVAISFLASFIGLDGIAGKVKEIIKKIRKPIDKAVGKVVGVIANLAKKAWGQVKGAGKAVAGKVKAGVGKLVEWWKLRNGFTAADGTRHTLLFNGQGKNAVLIMRSNPITLTTFLNNQKAQNNPNNQKIIQSAEQILLKIKNLQNSLPDKNANKRMLKGSEKQNQEGYLELKQLLSNLANLLSQFHVANKNLLPVIYPPFVNNVKASHTTKVEYLNMADGKGFAKGSKAGSHSGKLMGWDQIEQCELTNGRGGTFVKMHLIPECLGGYATDSNLTPGEAKLNSTLRDEVEQPAKNAIANKQDMIWYEVRLRYHSGQEYENFIASINVQWGYYIEKEGKWEKQNKAEKQVSQSVAPPTFKIEPININNETNAKKVRHALKISRTKAELIIKERDTNGKFKRIDDIIIRVDQLSAEQQDAIRRSYSKNNFSF